ncbi:MAG: UDP-N-acetylglucosamine--N-acetylmuramyl-(pentapeptide) pyrophosphoryl-undecaprenol N-acetylglucosamine transferase [Candidatus Daviesbacteria bacterium]
MKILLTGSHFTPAQAVINEFKNYSDLSLVYLGRRSTREGDKTLSVESQVLPELGVKFIPITAGRLQRSFTIHTIPSLLKIPIGIFQSFYFVLKEQPDVVLSFGGYVAVPVVISSWLLSIPIIIHEQTLVSGLANTICSLFADKIAVSFKSHSLKGEKVIVTGNPIRQEITESSSQIPQDLEIKNIIQLVKKENLPLVLITGGNQGSHVINQAVAEILGDLTKIAFVVHQTGDSKFQDFEKLTEQQKTLKYPQRYIAKKWVGGADFGAVLQNADLVISRAGVNTLLELAYFGIPTLVIPIPYLYKDEQNVNAKFFEKSGLVKILSQKDLSGKNLQDEVLKMLKDLDHLKKEAKKAREVVISDAAKRLVLETLLLAKIQK